MREAADRALDDAGMTLDDIDAVVIGKAPDMFEGVMMPELYLADALGAVGKPMIRVHTAGSVGGSTAIVAAQLVQAGIHKRVLTVAFEKQSESDAMWALSLPIPFQPPMLAGAGGYFAPHIRVVHAPLEAPDHIGILVAVKDRLNALQEPVRAPARARHHLRDGRGVADAVGPDPLRRDVPVVRRRVRDGARQPRTRCRGAAAAGVDARHGDAQRADDVRRPRPGATRRRQRLRAPTCTGRPASPTRASEIDCVEMYVPFSWYEPMWLENLGFAAEGEGWKLIEDGATAIDGDLPVNCRAACCRRTRSARRACSASPRPPCRCAARPASTRSTAPARALGHAYGGGSQFFAMWVVGADKP